MSPAKAQKYDSHSLPFHLDSDSDDTLFLHFTCTRARTHAYSNDSKGTRQSSPFAAAAAAQIQFEFLHLGEWNLAMGNGLRVEWCFDVACNLYARRSSPFENSHELCENTELLRCVHVAPVQAENN